jgi:hypothetical protein
VYAWLTATWYRAGELAPTVAKEFENSVGPVDAGPSCSGAFRVDGWGLTS